MTNCPNCGREMERIESDETSWWECAICGIDPSRDEEIVLDEERDEDEGVE